MSFAETPTRTLSGMVAADVHAGHILQHEAGSHVLADVHQRAEVEPHAGKSGARGDLLRAH